MGKPFTQTRQQSNFSDLLLMLVMRDIKIRYKQSLLGVAWAIFLPLSLMLIFTFIFSRVAPLRTGDIPYPVFAYVGLVPWQFFRSGVLAATSSLVAYPNLITKIYCPRQVFPLAAVASKLIDFLVASTVLFGLMVYYRIPLSSAALWFPLLFGIQILLMLGLGYIVSMGNLFYRDVGYVMEVFLLVLMFATAVVYPTAVGAGWAGRLLALNPLTPLFDAYRDVLIRGINPDWNRILYPLAWAVALSIGGYIWFMRKEPLFAERI
ncbi:MAG: hypothetical protein A3J52_02190 [Omnitrophica bacterium RIFCSPHIGHO2_02_FULL_49_9]|nr:MAG: hypothetical protein A3J52_02190 [Omnitrophica bacterium RIFCSPHIGHO2_02_FULL_49_9]OGW88267.1 MAG: hypothetical protein A3A73_00455 [Omnitrophica bacterium RIFCSPLOWO2_01_FULL_50_24]